MLHSSKCKQFIFENNKNKNHHVRLIISITYKIVKIIIFRCVYIVYSILIYGNQLSNAIKHTLLVNFVWPNAKNSIKETIFLFRLARFAKSILQMCTVFNDTWFLTTSQRFWEDSNVLTVERLSNSNII